MALQLLILLGALGFIAVALVVITRDNVTSLRGKGRKPKGWD